MSIAAKCTCGHAVSGICSSAGKKIIQPSVEDMNEAIAIFDGWEKKNKREFVKDGCVVYVWELMKYHISWDVLMPVYYKIREKAFEHRDNERATVLLKKLNTVLMYGTRADVHLKAFDFITWLNSQQTTTNDK